VPRWHAITAAVRVVSWSFWELFRGTILHFLHNLPGPASRSGRVGDRTDPGLPEMWEHGPDPAAGRGRRWRRNLRTIAPSGPAVAVTPAVVSPKHTSTSRQHEAGHRPHGSRTTCGTGSRLPETNCRGRARRAAATEAEIQVPGGFPRRRRCARSRAQKRTRDTRSAPSCLRPATAGPFTRGGRGP
jgi:hypothetical protein